MTTNTSRRDFLKAASILTLSTRFAAAAQPVFAYVGTYSDNGPDGGAGLGIHIFELNPTTGALTEREPFRDKTNPSCLAFSRDRTRLYAVNETSSFEGTKSGGVSAFSVDRATGALKLLNRVSSRGTGPTHLSVHPAGKHVLVANYGSGCSTVIPILPGGDLGPATDVKEHKGTVGSQRAKSAPRGSFAISGHDAARAHMIEADPAGRFVLTADLGLDQILVWKFDAASGTLAPAGSPTVQLPDGDGPRHFAFHPNARWLYCLQEEGSTLAVFDYSAADGKLTGKQTLSTLPKGFTGTNFTSEVRISADGRFVYAANRLHDSIAIFSIGADGRLTWVGEEWTRGDYPRSFTIEPSGNFLYSCNQKGDAVAVFRVNRETGRLSFTGHYIPVGTPSMIAFA
jgi:6-phosphogluconolactonase